MAGRLSAALVSRRIAAERWCLNYASGNGEKMLKKKKENPKHPYSATPLLDSEQVELKYPSIYS